jgi:hypothetical protein
MSLRHSVLPAPQSEFCKEHRYWSVVESVRTRRGVYQRQLLYLGELNDSQKAQWCSALDVLDESNDSIQQMSLFPDDRTPPSKNSTALRICRFLTVHNPARIPLNCYMDTPIFFYIPSFRSRRKPVERGALFKKGF